MMFFTMITGKKIFFITSIYLQMVALMMLPTFPVGCLTAVSLPALPRRSAVSLLRMTLWHDGLVGLAPLSRAEG